MLSLIFNIFQIHDIVAGQIIKTEFSVQTPVESTNSSVVASQQFSVPEFSVQTPVEATSSRSIVHERFSVPEFKKSSEKIKKITVRDKISAVAEDRLAQRDAEIRRNALFHPKEMELKELEVKEKMKAFQHMERMRQMEVEEREADMEYKRRMRVLDMTLKEKEVELMIMKVEMMKKKMEEWIKLYIVLEYMPVLSKITYTTNIYWYD